MNDDGAGCFPGTKFQAAATGLSERTVCTHLELAAAAGYIEKRRRGNSGKRGWSHEYVAMMPERTEARSVPKADIQGHGAERHSVPSPERTERGDIKGLNEVQRNSTRNSPSIETPQDEYLWQRGVIKLNEKDFRKWQELASLSEDDLDRYLSSRADWLESQPDSIQRKWFISTERDLKNKFAPQEVQNTAKGARA